MYRIKYLPTGKFINTDNLCFTYERARQAARKHARKMVKKGKLKKEKLGYWDKISRQPTFLSATYSIVKVG